MPLPEARFAVLMFTDIVDSTDLTVRHGVPAYSAALRRHNALFEDIARGISGMQIVKNTGDGYFALFAGVAEAVCFALQFQNAMRQGPWPMFSLTTRLGIHAGEVADIETLGKLDVVAPAANLAARVMSLAGGGQILLARTPFDEARHFVREHPPVPGASVPVLCWLAHGPYMMKGVEAPIEIFEVGAEGLAPLAPPPDSEKAKRAIRPGEEETLGWRPADGLEIPGRPGWRLVGKLGAGGFGEVWVGEQAKLRQRRAFKFCFDDERLRALKREVTLVRLLRSALGDRDDIVRIHELKLDAPPFYLESDLAPHGNLLQWAERQGGLDKIPLAQRIALVAHTATALAAAHSIGVLHKDIKPTNILIFDGPGGEPRPRLVDFGIGTLADPAVLREHGVTAAGFTRTRIEHSTGTPTYSPPEYLAGKPYTIQGDIYGLGVLLYQLLTAKPLDPLAPGWERDIPDPLLREDIAACVDGDPARRLPSAADLAERLQHLDERRAEIAEKVRTDRDTAARAEAEAAASAARVRAARLRKLSTAFAVLALLAIAAGVVAWWQRGLAIEQRERSRTMLIEAARSDCSVAEERLTAGDEQAAFAYLARACEYDPASTFAAEKAAAVLNRWKHRFSAATLVGHAKSVLSAQFSRDSRRIVTASNDNTARVWEVASGQSLATLKGHENCVNGAQFNPDGARIVTASDDQTARVWDAVTGQSLATLSGHEDSVNSAQFSPDGTRIVTASDDHTARVWDAATGQSLATLSGHEDGVNSAQFSPDGTRIVTASDDHTARVWDGVTGQSLATLSGHDDDVNSAQFSLDGTRIVTACADTTARVWNAASGKSLVVLARHETAVNSAQFSTNGMWVVTASGNPFWESKDNTARLWEAASGKLLATLAGHKEAVTNAHFDSDDNLILTASLDNTARVWGINAIASDGSHFVTVTDVAILAGHQSGVWSAQFSPDGRSIVTASADGAARVWDAVADNPNTRSTRRESIVRGAQSRPDGRRFVVASQDGNTALVLDAVTGRSIATLAGHVGSVDSAEFSPDGTRIVTTSKPNTVRVWDVATGRSLATLVSDPVVSGAQFSSDGSRIAIGSDNDTAHVWNILPPTAGPPPEWFADFLRYMAQMRLNSDGELEALKPGDWLALRERMRAVRRASAGQDTPYLRILRRFVPE